MNNEDSEAATAKNISQNHANSIPEKTCSELKDDSIIFNVPSLPVDIKQSSPHENNTNNRTDSTPNSTATSKPSTSSSGKSKRRSGGGKKHRAGRNQKRKWKPYNKLTWEEKQRLDERNARRAQRIRDQMSAVGIPVAPYNTSQFLINDYLSCHVIKTPDYNHSEDSSEEHDHEEHYYQQAFLEDYANMHEEYLNSLTQYELAEEWVNLEDKIEVVDKQLKELREQRTTMGVDDDHPHEVMEKIGVFRIEIEKLFKENRDLMVENEKMRELLGECHTSL